MFIFLLLYVHLEKQEGKWEKHPSATSVYVQSK